ncbi:MAG TPA: tripartite tricarboxylate transporter TctB family protein [Allosphingosinicella sp.]
MLLLAAMAWTARDFAKLAAYFPITVATLGVALAFIELGLSRRAVTDPPTAQDDEEDAEFTKHLTGGVGYLAGLALYLVAMMVLGFFSATIVYLVLMLWKGAGMRPVAALGLAVAMAAFMSMFGGYIGLVFPLGYLDSAVLALFG